MNKHIISLKGPWLVRTVVSGETNTIRLNIKSPEDWKKWQVGSEYSGELTLERKFNWLFPEPAPDRIELLIKSRLQPEAILNGEPVQLDNNDSCLSADITHLLQSANRIELKFQPHRWSAESPVLETIELLSHD